MITRDSIESAYCFFHQKWQVYRFSTNPQQRDDIEYAIAQYAESMNKELYTLLANGLPDFLLSHKTFTANIAQAVSQLDKMMIGKLNG